MGGGVVEPPLLLLPPWVAAIMPPAAAPPAIARIMAHLAPVLKPAEDAGAAPAALVCVIKELAVRPWKDAVTRICIGPL